MSAEAGPSRGPEGQSDARLSTPSRRGSHSGSGSGSGAARAPLSPVSETFPPGESSKSPAQSADVRGHRRGPTGAKSPVPSPGPEDVALRSPGVGDRVSRLSLNLPPDADCGALSDTAAVSAAPAADVGGLRNRAAVATVAPAALASFVGPAPSASASASTSASASSSISSSSAAGVIMPVKASQAEIEAEERETSFCSLIMEELALPTHKDPSPGRTADRVRVFITLPWELEKLLFLGQLVCTNAFLHVLALLPVRFVTSSVYCILDLLGYLFGGLLGGKSGAAGATAAAAAGKGGKGGRSRGDHQCDVARGLLFLWTLVALTWISTADVYHYIRVQNMMKLYVIFNITSIFERLLASIGDDIMDALCTSITKASGSGDGGAGLGSTPAAVGRSTPHGGYGLGCLGNMRWGVLTHLIIAAVYMPLHALLTLIQVTTLNVCINSHGIAILVMLNVVNFVELKSTVFKKFFHANLFQLSLSDSVERFQAATMLVTILVQNIAHMGLHKTDAEWLANFGWISLRIFGMELAVDWVKHGFMNKYNNLPNYYRPMRTVIARDIVLFRSQRDHPYYQSVPRRFGCVVEPYAIVFIRASVIALAGLHCSLGAKLMLAGAALACAAAFKLCLGVGLLAYASTHLLDAGKGRFDPLDLVVLPLDPTLPLNHPSQPPSGVAAYLAEVSAKAVLPGSGSEATSTSAASSTSSAGQQLLGKQGADGVAPHQQQLQGQGHGLHGRSTYQYPSNPASTPLTVSGFPRVAAASSFSLQSSPFNFDAAEAAAAVQGLGIGAGSGDGAAAASAVSGCSNVPPVATLLLGASPTVDVDVSASAPSGILAAASSAGNAGAGAAAGDGKRRGSLVQLSQQRAHSRGASSSGAARAASPPGPSSVPAHAAATPATSAPADAASPEGEGNPVLAILCTAGPLPIPKPTNLPEQEQHRRDVAGALGQFRALGGFSRSDADKAKAAIPLEAVVRYNMYSNKIPI